MIGLRAGIEQPQPLSAASTSSTELEIKHSQLVVSVVFALVATGKGSLVLCMLASVSLGSNLRRRFFRFLRNSSADRCGRIAPTTKSMGRSLARYLYARGT